MKVLKKILKKIKGFYIFFKYKIKFIKYLIEKKPYIFIIATPTHGNLGDQAIVFSEYFILEKLFPERKIFEIPNNCYLKCPKLCKKHIRRSDYIVIDGGGNLGTLWENEDGKISNIISDFKDNKIVIFPQTCFYSNNESSIERLEKNRVIYESAKDLSVMLRDKKSFDFFCKVFPNTKAFYVPDIVLFYKPQLKKTERKNVLLCFRTDREKNISDQAIFNIETHLKDNRIDFRYTSTLVNKKVTEKTRRKELFKKWEEFSRAELIITDRLHAMIFSAITNTPCLAVDNISKKVGGVYEWIKDLSYIKYLSDYGEICENIKPILNKKNNKYDFEYPINMIRSIFT